jgi:hypothetical protein
MICMLLSFLLGLKNVELLIEERTVTRTITSLYAIIRYLFLCKVFKLKDHVLDI